MIKVRRAQSRGLTRLDWLCSHHTFSFGSFRDPEHMGFASLRALNEDWVAPGQGFGTHPHQEVEILTWVLEGRLQHRDSLGHGSLLDPGEIQRMSAGTGVSHSEFNASETEPVHFLQIWIIPESPGLVPSWEQRCFPDSKLRNRLCLVASREGRENSAMVHQDVDVWAGRLDGQVGARHALPKGRRAWVQVASGGIDVNGIRLGAGDGAAASEEEGLLVRALEEAELLLFDLG